MGEVNLFINVFVIQNHIISIASTHVRLWENPGGSGERLVGSVLDGAGKLSEKESGSSETFRGK